MGLIGMAQVLATLAHGIKGLRREVSTWDSRGPFMAAVFLLVFWILFSGHDEAGLSPNTQVFGC